MYAGKYSEPPLAAGPNRPSWASGGSGAQAGQFCYYF